MQWLFDLIYSIVDDPATMQIAIVIAAALAAIVLGMGVLYIGMGASDPIRRRLTHFEGTEDLGEGRKVFNIHTILGPITQYVVPAEEIERNATIERLTYAGYRAPNAMQVYYSIKAILTVTLPIIVYATSFWMPDLDMTTFMLMLVGSATLGMFLPNFVLDKQVSTRIKKLRNGFPDALDLLVVCVESGLGLTQALQRVADEIIVSHSELGLELAVVNAEIGAGVDQVTALKNFAERTGLEDVRGLVSLLIQTLKFGTGVADSLRVYAFEFRDKRMQLAEEQAAKIGTKLIFPLILFMFPGFFVVALGPAIIRLMSVFGNV
jgi:tight adherence protein C